MEVIFYIRPYNSGCIRPQQTFVVCHISDLIVSVVFEMSNCLKNPHSYLQNARYKIHKAFSNLQKNDDSMERLNELDKHFLPSKQEIIYAIGDSVHI